MTNIVRLAVYLRCSTTEQETEGMSLEAQEGAIRAWAAVNGAEIVDVIVDGAVSGTKPLADREGGAKIMALLNARKPTADAVAVIRTDRLGRDAAERLALYKRFRTGKVGLVSIKERVDLATPHGRAMAAVSAVFSALERDLIAERTTEALTELRRQGRAWNHAPFGWIAHPDGHLLPFEDEQDTLQLIRDMRDEGLSYAKVAAALVEKGRPTKRGGRWAAATVHSVLRAQPDAVTA